MKPTFLFVVLAGAFWSASMVRAQAQAYAWSTLAGLCGPANSGSADGTNGTARFYYPKGVAADGAGNLYVADTGNHAVRKITPVGTSWVVSTLAGAAGAPGDADGTNNAARFWSPVGIALDSAGNLYVADSARHTVRRLAPAGTDWVVTTIAGLAGIQGSSDGTNSKARFYKPTFIAVDQRSNLYVSDTGNETVRKITPVGTNWVVSTLAGSVGTSASRDGMNGAAWFDDPNGIAVDSTVGGSATNSGAADGTGADARFYTPLGVAVNPAGDVYVADSWNHAIRLGRFMPCLRCTFSGRQLILSWPTNVVGFLPESSVSLARAASWTPVTNALAVVADCFVLTNSLDVPTAFYRLRK